ncbi:MAG TPA: hypothetical protein VGQ24_13325 [Gemmatimonadales bacterium]|jgi:hypothetical protein|nr:hypothetical protein [Gemmatimonadales bacterium]
MSAKRINCSAKNRYQVDIRIPNDKGDLAAPSAAGLLGGIKVRFSTTRNGAAIAGDVDNLAATETTGKIGRMYYELSQALHQSRLLTLGEGAPFFAIWFLTGQFDIESIEYQVGTGTYQ